MRRLGLRPLVSSILGGDALQQLGLAASALWALCPSFPLGSEHPVVETLLREAVIRQLGLGDSSTAQLSELLHGQRTPSLATLSRLSKAYRSSPCSTRTQSDTAEIHQVPACTSGAWKASLQVTGKEGCSETTAGPCPVFAAP